MSKWMIAMLLISLNSYILADSTFGIKELLKKFDGRQYPLRSYVERRESDFLITPIVSEGYISYENNELIKLVNNPFKKKFTVIDDVLIITDGEYQKTISISDYPGLKSFVTVFRAILAGDYEGLIEDFNTNLSGNVDRWSLELKPKNVKLKSIIYEIAVNGKFDQINSFDFYENGGDHIKIILGKIDNE